MYNSAARQPSVADRSTEAVETLALSQQSLAGAGAPWPSSEEARGWQDTQCEHHLLHPTPVSTVRGASRQQPYDGHYTDCGVVCVASSFMYMSTSAKLI